MGNSIVKKLSSNKPSQNQNQNQNQNQYFAGSESYHRGNGSSNVNLLKPADPNKKVVAVIVTFCSGSSYDHLFSSVQQKAEQGTQVLVYACSSDSVKQILDGFKKPSENQSVKKMIQYIKQVDTDCVVFNWECSSGYSSQSFSEGKGNVLQFAKMMIDRGHMTMFSDFSLKALISQWDQKLLGPNPFKKVAQYGGAFTLQFENKTLQSCPSAQLQIVGDMAAQGHCNVQAMGGTIVYGVDLKKTQTAQYKLNILTVVTNLDKNNNYSCEINGKKGMAGHVLLTYKSGGHLLTSMGHWAELMMIDTSQKVLFDVAARQFGQQKAKQMQMQYANLSSQSQKKAYISKNAVQFVQSQAPCSNMAKKAKSKW